MNNEDFKKIVSVYLRELQSNYESVSSAKSNEETLRPRIYQFIAKLAKEIEPEKSEVIHEDYRDNAKPDITIRDRSIAGKPFFGIIEHKNLNPNKKLDNIVIESNKRQLKKYSEYLSSPTQRLIVTDGIDFLFLKPDYFESKSTRYKCVSIARKPLPECWGKAQIDPNFLTLFKKLLQQPGTSKYEIAELIACLADLSKDLSKDIQILLDKTPRDSEQKKFKAAITSLQDSMVKNSHSQLESDKLFSDFTAEVLVFGLFHAHYELENKEKGTLGIPQKRKPFLEKYWERFEELPKRTGLRPFSAVWKATKESGLDESISKVLDLLAHADVWRHLKHPPNFHSLYQTFVEAKGKDTWEYGEFITPVELVRWMARGCIYIADKELKVSLFSKANKIIDPACGTGIFIEEILKLLPKGNINDGPMLRGFEIQAVPHALATRRLWDYASHKSLHDKIGFFLCDTLSDKLAKDKKPEKPEGLTQVQQYLFEDYSDAWNSALPPLVAIIGNPPATTKAQGMFASERRKNRKRIEELSKDWVVKGANLTRAIKNEWALFLRWAVDRVEESKGIVCMVIPESFLELSSFMKARKFILDNFSRSIVLEVDKNCRIQGKADDQLFSKVLQGRSVLIAVKDLGSDKNNALNTPIMYYSIKDKTLDEKKHYLDSMGNKKNSDIFKSFKELKKGQYREHNNYSFRPTKPVPKLYNSFWHLSGNEKSLFVDRVKGGIKLAPVSLNVASDPDILKDRSRYIAKGKPGNWQHSVGNILEEWFKKQKKPPSAVKFTDAVRLEIGKSAKSDPISYSYRPFVKLYCINQTQALQSAFRKAGGKSSGYRFKQDIYDLMHKHKALGFSVAGGTKEIAKDIQHFTTFCWYIPDNDLAKRSNGFIHLDKRENGESNICEKVIDHVQMVVNSNIDFNINIPMKYSWDKICSSLNDDPSRIFLFYAYAVLCSRYLIEEYSGAYYSISNPDDRFRIPIALGKRHFAKLSLFGYMLARLENWEDKEIWNLSFESVLQANFDLPKRNTKDNNPFIKKGEGPYRIMKKALEHYTDKNTEFGRILLYPENSPNAEFWIDEIPAHCLKTEISGYNVLDSWLRERTYPYLRRNLKLSDFEELKSLLWRLDQRDRLIHKVDACMEDLLRKGENGLLRPL